jgi:hypothetical protein
LPDQSIHAGKFLQTNGTKPSWIAIAESPWTTYDTNIGYSTGNVGIGTTSFYNAFTVGGIDNTASTSNGIFLDVVNQSGINGTLTGIRFKKNAVSTNERHNSGIFYDGNSLMFATKTNTLATNITTDDADLTIANTGFVGIGTPTPGGLLTVYRNTASATATMLNILEASGTGDASMQFTTQGGNTISMGVDASDAHKFKISDGTIVGSTDRLTITTTGDIGIGTNAPSAKLDIVGGTELNGAFVTPSSGSTTISGTSQILAKPARRVVKITASTTGRAIFGITQGEDGQEVILLNTSIYSIVAVGSYNPGSNNTYDMILAGNFAMTSYATLHLIYDGTNNVWVEIGRTEAQAVLN